MLPVTFVRQLSTTDHVFCPAVVLTDRRSVKTDESAIR